MHPLTLDVRAQAQPGQPFDQVAAAVVQHLERQVVQRPVGDHLQPLDAGQAVEHRLAGGDPPGPDRRGEPDQQALLNWKGTDRIPKLSEILMRSATLTSETITRDAAIARADIYLRMPVTDIGMFAWDQLDTLIERGYDYAMEELPKVIPQAAS